MTKYDTGKKKNFTIYLIPSFNFIFKIFLIII